LLIGRFCAADLTSMSTMGANVARMTPASAAADALLRRAAQPLPPFPSPPQPVAHPAPAGQAGDLVRSRLLASALAPSARPARISAMLVAIIAMSLADLYMTLAHVLHFGMIEANPIARRIMETGSPAELIIWKLTTVLLAVGIFFAFRRQRTGEIGALACLVVMTWLTAHWFNYNTAVSTLTPDMHALATVNEHGFVSMSRLRPGE
jgi:hypothetical protein